MSERAHAPLERALAPRSRANWRQLVGENDQEPVNFSHQKESNALCVVPGGLSRDELNRNPPPPPSFRPLFPPRHNGNERCGALFLNASPSNRSQSSFLNVPLVTVNVTHSAASSFRCRASRSISEREA